MSPVELVVIVCAAISAFTWIASLITGDSSWVDRMWSIAPVIYVWIFAASAGFADVRLNVMTALVTLWGARLTFNFARKGGYFKVEDYRWPIVRARMKPWQYQIFNLLFIVIFQNILLALIAMPALTAYDHPDSPFGALSMALAVLFALCLIGETVADQQQWDFHKWKGAERAAGRTPNPQFLQTGLFSYSRHPNYFFELAQWWLFFLMGAAAAGTIFTWTVLGVVLLTLLFVGSTRLTEQITLSKYPEYADYQRRVSSVIPWFPRKAPVEQTA